VDFGRPEEARRTINAWVEKKTRGKIQDLIPPGALNYLDRLVLANAIYFKGTWLAWFSKGETRDEPFHLLGGAQVTAPLMRQLHTFSYADLDSLQVLELPYGDGDLAMLLALPRDLQGLPSLEQSLSGDLLDAWIASLQETDVQVFLPRFSITQIFNLNEVMQSLGMRRAFSQNAEFSGMADEDLYISAILHKAFIDTDEHGTEAAAATAVGMTTWGVSELTSSPPEFRADHPFLFMIRHRPSGCILFMGRVLDPTR
jgi:serpin B